MRRARQIGAFVRLDLIEISRHWHTQLFSVGVTLAYCLIFVSRAPESTRSSLTLTFAGLAMLAVAIFRFGGQIARERTLAWGIFLRTMPVPVWVKFSAHAVGVLSMGAVGAMSIVIAGKVYLGVVFDTTLLVRLPVMILFGMAVFTPIGICIGYLFPPRLVPIIGSFLYMASALGTGLFTAGQSLIQPPWLDQIQPLRLMQRFSVALTTVDGTGLVQPALLGAAWILVTLLIATIAYRRDEADRFG